MNPLDRRARLQRLAGEIRRELHHLARIEREAAAAAGSWSRWP